MASLKKGDLKSPINHYQAKNLNLYGIAIKDHHSYHWWIPNFPYTSVRESGVTIRGSVLVLHAVSASLGGKHKLDILSREDT